MLDLDMDFHLPKVTEKCFQPLSHIEFAICESKEFLIQFILSLLLFYLFIFVFLGPQWWHMEVPRLGVKLEL